MIKDYFEELDENNIFSMLCIKNDFYASKNKSIEIRQVLEQDLEKFSNKVLDIFDRFVNDTNLRDEKKEKMEILKNNFR